MRPNPHSSVQNEVGRAFQRSLNDLGGIRKLARPDEPVTMLGYQRIDDHSEAPHPTGSLSGAVDLSLKRP
jgi:hypothetical protein